MSRKDKKSKKKAFFAVLAVALMLMSSVIVLADGSDADTWAPNGTGDYYSYTLNYDASKMGETAQQSYQLTVEGMTPISHAPGTTTLSAVANEGSWGFDRTTGIGPFNSFYGAFDMTQGNRFFAILNPYDLTKTISGASLDPIANYNIMWVLPTVYWSTDENGNVTLTNDPSAGGTAYAHTIDGKIREYVAYGVYEGSTKTIDDKTVLTSQSGATPTAFQPRATFRVYAHNYTMDSDLGASDDTPAYGMLWNFYQWTLYKLVAYTVMEGFNSQMLVGNGNVNGNNYTMTNGLTNILGPYAGNPGDLGASGDNATAYGRDAVRLFIENAWGTVYDFVDGVILAGMQAFYVDTSSTPTDSTAAGGNVERIAQALPSDGFGSAISTNAQIWGFPTATGSQANYNVGTTDYIYTSSSSGRVLFVGGSSSTNASNSVYYGLSYASASNGLSTSGNTNGTRLAFVYGETMAGISIDAVPPVGDVEPTYTAVFTGSRITISGNSLTIGSETITATPSAGYRLTGWYSGGEPIADGDIVTGNMDIRAVFEAIPQYTVTWDINGETTTETYYEGETPTHTDPTPPEGLIFQGWQPEISPVTGDITYTAVFVEPPNPEQTLAKFIPLIVILGIIMLAASAIASFRGTGFDMVKLMVGLAVCILVTVYALLPATGGI